MTTPISLPITAPPLPSTWIPELGSSGRTLAPFVDRTLLPVGPAYLAHVRRTIHNHSFEDHDKHESERRLREESAESDGVEDDLGVGDEGETPELLALDPKEWKKQDHYAVLGLSHLRYTATQEQIKIAHRKKVLRHHPDKKAGIAGDANDDAFFKCIQKALEVLSNSEKRRQFDSVDPYFMELEEEVPRASDAKRAVEKDPNAFFTLFSPVFEREARFSKKQPVPLLGAMNDSKKAVEGFYDFWYNFDSWRSFEYLDKEVNEGSDNRDDKRYTEKKNKTERARRKKEDTARLRSLVDIVLSVDPRIKRIKNEEKEAREAKKRKGKPEISKQVELEVQEAEQAAKQKEEEELKREKKRQKEEAAKKRKQARRVERAAQQNADDA